MRRVVDANSDRADDAVRPVLVPQSAQLGEVAGAFHMLMPSRKQVPAPDMLDGCDASSAGCRSVSERRPQAR
jgi:hypothetical protein